MGDELKVTQADDALFIELIREYPSLGAHEYALKRMLARHRIATETQSQATIDELNTLRAFRDRVVAAVEFVEPLALGERLALESAVVADRKNGMSLRKCAEKHGTTLSVVRTILSRHGESK